jgi:hypothetical protein
LRIQLNLQALCQSFEAGNLSAFHSIIKFLLDSHRSDAILALGCEEC